MRLLLIVIAVGVILRVGSALYQGTTIQAMPGVTDQISYHELAIRLLNGHGFSFGAPWWPATRANQPTAHWSYLYVLFLSAIYSVVGPAPLVARLLQAVLVGILHPLLVWRIGRRLFNPSVGLVSAAVTSVYGYFVFYAGALVTESLYLLVFLWVLDIATALVYAARGRDGSLSLRPWILLGIAFGTGALLRQVFLLLVPVILGWMAWELLRQREGGRRPFFVPLALAGRMVLTVALLLACVLPWTLRNYNAFGQVVLLNTNAGFVFFWGNHPIHGTEFIPILPNDPTTNYMTLLPREFRRLNEAQLDRALLVRGFGFVKDDPERYIRLSVSRAKEYFKFWPTADSGTASNYLRVLSFGLALPFLVLGLILALTRRADEARPDTSGAMLLLLVAGVYSVVHLLTWTLVRYRLPVDAIMMPFVGVAIVFVYQRAVSLVQVSNVSLPSSAN
jgi:Dolichyl-phosphate-mannose-protein mannosyltransferase